MTTTYQSFFFSPRKFANEGIYVYGTKEEIEVFEKTITRWEDIGWWCAKNHRSEKTAQEHCERSAKKDINSTPSHEICCISHGHVSELI